MVRLHLINFTLVNETRKQEKIRVRTVPLHVSRKSPTAVKVQFGIWTRHPRQNAIALPLVSPPLMQPVVEPVLLDTRHPVKLGLDMLDAKFVKIGVSRIKNGKFRLTLSEPRFNAVETFYSQSPYWMHHRFFSGSIPLFYPNHALCVTETGCQADKAGPLAPWRLLYAGFL